MPRKNISKQLTARAVIFKKLNLRALDQTQWRDRAHRSATADQVLQFRERVNALVPDDSAARRAFEVFHLSPDNPYHWRGLLDIFAELHFGKPRRAGARPKWTVARKSELAGHFVEEIKIMQKADIALPQSLEEVAVIIKKRHPKSYSDTTSRQMYVQLRSFFSRDENADTQFMTWISKRM